MFILTTEDKIWFIDFIFNKPLVKAWIAKIKNTDIPFIVSTF